MSSSERLGSLRLPRPRAREFADEEQEGIKRVFVQYVRSLYTFGQLQQAPLPYINCVFLSLLPQPYIEEIFTHLRGDLFDKFVER